MTVTMNAAMRALLSGQSLDLSAHVHLAPSELMRELAEGFEEVEGCVIPCGTHHGEQLIGPGDDETGVECQISKEHLEGFVTPETSFSEALLGGIGYVAALKEALEASDVPGPFRIILGANSEGEYPSIVARFHRMRPGQPWLGNDLDAYGEGVLAVDFKNKAPRNE